MSKGRSPRSRARQAPPSLQTSVGQVQIVFDPSRPGAATLVIDGQIHGHIDPSDLQRLELDYQARLVTIALALLPQESSEPQGQIHAVHLGGGTFTVPRVVAANRPDIAQTVIEKSAGIIRLAERELGLRRSDRLVVHKGDARAALCRMPDGTADLVVGDAFLRQSTPAHLMTVEFMAQVHRVLRPGGHYVVNIIDAQPWSGLGTHAAAAIQVFDQIAACGSRGVARLRDPGNVFLVASRDRMRRQRLISAGAVAVHPVALVAAGRLEGLARGSSARHDHSPSDQDAPPPH